MSWPQNFVTGFCFAALLVMGNDASTNERISAMDKAGWTTHCVGRFLVDFPSQVEIVSTFKIRGDEIREVDDAPEKVKERVTNKKKELELQRHETEGNMLIQQIEHNNESVTLLYWDKIYSKRMLREESYFFTPDGKRSFEYGGDVSPSRQHVAIANARDIARNIRSRNVAEVPASPGFCIDGGFITGNDYRSESFTIDIALPDHPGVQLEFFASTGAEENRLLERVGGFLRTEVLGTAAGLKTLRKRKRDVGPIDAEEYLVAASDKGQRVYSFAWESQGKDGSLSEPNLGVNLGVLEQSVVNEKEPYRPAFKSDEEALELWDAIIESIRLRPGAV